MDELNELGIDMVNSQLIQPKPPTEKELEPLKKLRKILKSLRLGKQRTFKF